MLGKYPAENVARRALEYMHRKIGEYAGLIMIDKKGNYSLAHITRKIAYAFIDDSGKIVSGIRL